MVNYFRCKMKYRINWSMVEQIGGSGDLWRNTELLISYSVVTISGVSLHLRSMKLTQALRK